jgi:hypothetical protein
MTTVIIDMRVNDYAVFTFLIYFACQIRKFMLCKIAISFGFPNRLDNEDNMVICNEGICHQVSPGDFIQVDMDLTRKTNVRAISINPKRFRSSLDNELPGMSFIVFKMNISNAFGIVSKLP